MGSKKSSREREVDRKVRSNKSVKKIGMNSFIFCDICRLPIVRDWMLIGEDSRKEGAGLIPAQHSNQLTTQGIRLFGISFGGE